MPSEIRRIRSWLGRPSVGAKGILESTGTRGFEGPKWLGRLLLKPSVLFIISAVLMWLIEAGVGNPSHPKGFWTIVIVYFVYIFILELSSRKFPESYDSHAFIWMRILTNILTISLLVGLSSDNGSYYWYFYVLPLFQSVIYFERRQLIITAIITVGSYFTASYLGFSFYGMETSFIPIFMNSVFLMVVTAVSYLLFRFVRANRNILQYQALLAVQKLPLAVNLNENISFFLQKALKEIMVAFEADGGSIYILDKSSQSLHSTTAIFLGQPVEESRTFAVGEGIIGHVALTKEPLLSIDTASERRFVYSKNSSVIKSLLSVPIVYYDQVLGVINLDKQTKQGFDEDDKQLLIGFASYIGDTLQRSALLGTLRTLHQYVQDDSQNVFELVMELLRENLDFDKATLFMKNGDLLEPEKWFGFKKGSEVSSLSIDISEDRLFKELIASRKALIIEETKKDKRFRALGDSKDVRSCLAIALIGDGETLGCLTIDSKRPKHFSPMDAELLQIFADHIVLAINRSKYISRITESNEELERQAEQLKVLNHLSANVNSSLGLDEMLTRSLSEMVSVFDVDHGAIAIADDNSDFAVVKYVFPEEAAGSVGDRIPLDSKISKLILDTMRPCGISDAVNDPRLEDVRDLIELRRIKSILIVPLIEDGAVVGTIGLDSLSKMRTFSREELQFAQTLANQISLAMAEAQLFRETKVNAELMKQLNHFAGDLSASLSLNIVQARIVENALRIAGANAVHLYRYQEESDELELVESDTSGGEDGTPVSPPRPNGITRWVVSNRKAIFIDDVVSSELFKDRVPTWDISAIASLPLIAKDQLLGVLNIVVGSEPTIEFGHELQSALQLYASQASAALANAHLYERNLRDLAFTQDFEKVVENLVAPTDLQEVLNTIVESAVAIGDADGAFVCVFNDQKDVFELDLKATFGIGAGVVTLSSARLSEAKKKELIAEDEMIIRDVLDENVTSNLGSRAQLHLAKNGIRSYVGLPLRSGTIVLGVLYVNFRDVFPPIDWKSAREILRIFADQAAVAVERALLFEKLKREQVLRDRIADATRSPDNMQRTLQEILNGALNLTEAEYGEVSIIDLDTNTLRPVVYDESSDYSLNTLSLEQGVTGWVARNQTSAVIGNVLEEVDWREIYRPSRPDVVSELAVPILDKDTKETLGVINLESPRELSFDLDEQRLLESIANHASIAIKNARLYSASQKYNARLTALLDSLRDVTSYRPRDEETKLYKSITDTIKDVLEYETVLLCPYVQSTKSFEKPVISTLEKHLSTVSDKPNTESFAHYLSHDSEPFDFSGGISVDLWLETERSGDLTLFTGYVRLDAGGETVGLLFVRSTRKYLPNADEVDAVRLFASLVSIAIYNARTITLMERRLDQLEFAQIGSFGFDSDSEHEIHSELKEIMEEFLRRNRFDSMILYPYDPVRRAYEKLIWAGNVNDISKLSGIVKIDGTVLGRREQNLQDVYFSEAPATDPIFGGRFVEDEGIAAACSLRLKIGGDTQFGFLFVNSHTPRIFSEPDEEMLQTMGDRISAIVYDWMRNKTVSQRFETLLEISRRVGLSLDIKENLDELYAALRNVYGDEVVPTVLTYDPNKEMLIVEGQGQDDFIEGEIKLDRPMIELGKGICGWVAKHREPKLEPNVLKSEEGQSFSLLKGTRAAMAVPICLEDQLVGVLNVESRIVNKFTEDDLKFLKLVSIQIARAIQNAEHYYAVSRASTIAVMSAWGAQVAHKLTTTVSNIRWLASEVDSDPSISISNQHLLAELDSDAAALLPPQLPIFERDFDRDPEKAASATLDEAISEGIDSLGQSASHVQMHTDLTCGDTKVHTENLLIQLMLSNLIQNSIDAEGDLPREIAVGSRVEGDYAVVRVSDNANGIPDEIVDKIFRFPILREDGKTGQGLFLVGFLADVRKGQAWVDWNRPNQGACLAFSVPLVPVEEAIA